MAVEPDPEIGERVERLRKRAGLSREHLASLADISPTLVKFIETGRRALTLRAAQRIAPHLGVRDLGDLFGSDIRLSLDGRPSHPGVPEVRRALTAWHLTASGEPSTPQYLRGMVDAAWRTWHTSRQQRSDAAALLPGLLDTTSARCGCSTARTGGPPCRCSPRPTTSRRHTLPGTATVS